MDKTQLRSMDSWSPHLVATSAQKEFYTRQTEDWLKVWRRLVSLSISGQIPWEKSTVGKSTLN